MASAANLYNSRVGKVRWFVKRFGALELVRKPLRLLLAPAIIPLLGRRTFSFRGSELEYFYHRYNMTWATERCLEVPIARYYLSRSAGESVLEVGNVLSHYGPIQHEVVDKFESGSGIINQDILEFAPARKYDLILSISTFEHIGFDDDPGPGSAQKILTAIQACRQLLQPAGKLVLTVPIGYNPELDQLIAGNRLGSQQDFFYRRTGPHRWEAANKAEALRCRYGRPYPYANGLLVSEILAGTAQ